MLNTMFAISSFLYFFFLPSTLPVSILLTSIHPSLWQGHLRYTHLTDIFSVQNSLIVSHLLRLLLVKKDKNVGEEVENLDPCTLLVRMQNGAATI